MSEKSNRGTIEELQADRVIRKLAKGKGLMAENHYDQFSKE